MAESALPEKNFVTASRIRTLGRRQKSVLKSQALQTEAGKTPQRLSGCSRTRVPGPSTAKFSQLGFATTTWTSKVAEIMDLTEKCFVYGPLR